MRIVLLAWWWAFHWFCRAVSVTRPWFVVGLMSYLSIGCAGTVPTHEPNVKPRHRFGVCTRDPDIEPNATSWAYERDRPPAVSNLHPYEYNRAILSSGWEYFFDPFAPASSTKFLPIALSTLPCDRMHTVELRPLQRDECSGDICALAWPREFELPNGGVCHIGKTASSSPPQGNWLGQTGQPAIRSTYFCNTEPLTPKNAPTRILDKKAEAAWLQGYWYGYRVSVLLTQAEADMQAVINKSDPWIVTLFKQDPGSVDDIMQRTAAKLDAIPEPPAYDTRHEAFYANDGYAAGARQGAFEVEATLELIEAGAIVVEVALMEVALGPLGGANALRAVLMRLRHIPVFIPGAAGGLGGFYKIAATTTRTLVKPSARRLAAAMKRAKIFRPPNTVPHHVVAHGADKAKTSVEILNRFGIGVDDAVNGVYLPVTKELAKKMGSTAHRHIHTDAYYEKVYQALKDATSRADVEGRLRRIAQQLKDGVFM